MSSTPVLSATRPAVSPAWVRLGESARVFAGFYALLCLGRLAWAVHEGGMLTTANHRRPNATMANLEGLLGSEGIFAVALYGALVPMVLFAVSFGILARLEVRLTGQDLRQVARHRSGFLYFLGLLGTVLLLAVVPGQGYDPYPNPYPRSDTDGQLLAAAHRVELSMGLHALCALLLIAGLLGLRRRIGRGSAG